MKFKVSCNEGTSDLRNGQSHVAAMKGGGCDKSLDEDASFIQKDDSTLGLSLLTSYYATAKTLSCRIFRDWVR